MSSYLAVLGCSVGSTGNPVPNWVDDNSESDTNEGSELGSEESPGVGWKILSADTIETSAVGTERSSLDCDETTAGRSLSPLPHRCDHLHRDSFVKNALPYKAQNHSEEVSGCDCSIVWVEKTTEELEKIKELAAETCDTPALFFRQKIGQAGEDPFVLHSIIVQSPLIRTVLQTILKDYPGVLPTECKSSIEAPFEPLLYNWTEISHAAKNDPRANVRRCLRELLKAVQPEYKKYLQINQEANQLGLITYDSLWAIFKPGNSLYFKEEEHECVASLVGAFYQVSAFDTVCFVLHCRYIDWDGTRLGTRVMDLKIDEFRGARPIHDLAAMPFDLHPEKLTIQERLVARGKKFENLRGCHFKAYAGPVMIYAQDLNGGLETSMQNDERIIIDASAFYEFTQIPIDEVLPLTRNYLHSHIPRPVFPPHCLQHLRPMHQHSVSSQISCRHRLHREELLSSKQQRVGRTMIGKQVAKEKNNVVSLTDEQRLLCAPYLLGYLLNRKQWVRVWVDGVKDITWNENSFSSLVLPNEEKDVLLALAHGHSRWKTNYADFYYGNEKGAVILLRGRPGMGKTMTVESIANTKQVPLYLLSAGPLGTSLDVFERELRAAMEKCARWSAILLVDRLDLFFGLQTMQNLDSNARISVFLRLLDDYPGMIFLTTNQPVAIDSALKSRIDITINYSEPSILGRRQIWSDLLMRLPAHQRVIGDQAIDQLAEFMPNGSKIESAVKIAHILAMENKERLSLDHVKTVLKLQEN